MKMLSLIVLALLWSGGLAARDAATAVTGTTAYATQEAAALQAVDAYIAAFNARDAERFAAALHYPHMRVDGLGRPAYWPARASTPTSRMWWRNSTG